ncbi:hypothetical protein [Pseudonocardia hydrocarbonoxydans]|uniref:Uncharacterized protein n=1 Tax=Pseudonocardia hydrocarbonoxydans TaxID=76726 RepID=A0A4Y3WQ18_9PSEU|nr:hypothetical protein [Pseudonocardia hydrocarbonoxydans]GEC20953.1 hypothetical protein PHY01_32360 [Pseudonocardia hydrocarbonoxydans]
MNDLLNGLSGVRTTIADALRACEADPGVLAAHLAICILKTTI